MDPDRTGITRWPNNAKRRAFAMGHHLHDGSPHIRHRIVGQWNQRIHVTILRADHTDSVRRGDPQHHIVVVEDFQYGGHVRAIRR